MAGKMSSSSIVAILVSCLALLQLSYAQTVYKVGGNTGWTIPSSNSLYSSWATKQKFNVGDTLEFNFTTGQHTVAEVSKSAFDSCNVANPISTATTGPANMTIKTAGAHYYICTIGTHCSMGQKLAVTAASSSSAPSKSPASAPTTSGSGSTTAAPPTKSSDSPAGAPTTSATPGGATADTPTGATTTGTGAGGAPAAGGPSANSATTNVAATGFLLVSSLVALVF